MHCIAQPVPISNIGDCYPINELFLNLYSPLKEFLLDYWIILILYDFNSSGPGLNACNTRCITLSRCACVFIPTEGIRYMRPIRVIGVGLYLISPSKRAFPIQATVFHAISYFRSRLEMSYIFFPFEIDYSYSSREHQGETAVAAL